MSKSRGRILERARTGVRESAVLEFKQEFDPSSGEAWCEVVKDIVAMANSGGGVIVFGVADNGKCAGFDAQKLLGLDIADITNRVAKYTGHQFAELEVVEVERSNRTCAALLIGEAEVPLAFVKPGTYDVGGGKQKTAFGQGTVYFRHGAKSEPGNRDDLAGWRDRAVERVRQQWMSGIRKVVDAPADHVVSVRAPDALLPAGTGIEARISSDPTARAFVPLNAEEIWPYRRTNLIDAVNRSLAGTGRVNGHDIQCVNKKYDVLKMRPEFAYKPHTKASPQYSQAYADWIVEQIRTNAGFIAACRRDYNP